MGCARVVSPISASSGPIDRITAAYKPAKIPSNSHKLPSHSHSNLHCGWNMLETYSQGKESSFFPVHLSDAKAVYPPFLRRSSAGRGRSGRAGAATVVPMCSMVPES